jgi:lipoate-protein ligase B
MTFGPARLLDVGRRPYRETWDLQRELHASVACGAAPDTWIVVEHDPVVTLGRNARAEHLLLSREALAARGVDCVAVERGGDVTYHGPGQLVVYPIVKLARFREVVPFVTALEQSVITALRTFGIAAHARSEHRGAYVGADSICAIGISVKALTSMHGLALNVSTALDYDRLITPCGTPQFGITSMERELTRPVAREAALDALLVALGDRFGITFAAEELAPA